MKCIECKKKLIWQSDNSFEDLMIEGEGIVSNYICSNCETLTRTYKLIGGLK
jgi:hypothetical protein